jgi:hypothetical protein
MTQSWARVLFELDPAYWPGPGGETLWAEPIASSEWMNFRLMNSPFHVRGVSYRDVVRATPIEQSDVFRFEKVIERGGHSTYMIIIDGPSPRVDAYWNLLRSMGCSYESATVHWEGEKRKLYSVDVPPSADVHEVYDILERGENDKVWIFQEGHAYLPGRGSTP